MFSSIRLRIMCFSAICLYLSKRDNWRSAKALHKIKQHPIKKFQKHHSVLVKKRRNVRSQNHPLTHIQCNELYQVIFKRKHGVLTRQWYLRLLFFFLNTSPTDFHILDALNCLCWNWYVNFSSLCVSSFTKT